MLEQDRRAGGQDRRMTAGGAGYAGRERRRADRRQISVAEISFREWAAHLLHFKQHLLRREKRRAEREARKRQEGQTKPAGKTPSGEHSRL